MASISSNGAPSGFASNMDTKISERLTANKLLNKERSLGADRAVNL